MTTGMSDKEEDMAHNKLRREIAALLDTEDYRPATEPATIGDVPYRLLARALDALGGPVASVVPQPPTETTNMTENNRPIHGMGAVETAEDPRVHGRTDGSGY